jgi:hypothetical protein
MSDSIDITNLVDSMREDFVVWATNFIYLAEISIPAFSWVATPIVSDIDKDIVKAILESLSKSVVMLAFFENTAIKKVSQAKDYISTKTALKALPVTASAEEYADAEKKNITAFASFVSLTS